MNKPLCGKEGREYRLHLFIFILILLWIRYMLDSRTFLPPRYVAYASFIPTHFLKCYGPGFTGIFEKYLSLRYGFLLRCKNAPKTLRLPQTLRLRFSTTQRPRMWIYSFCSQLVRLRGQVGFAAPYPTVPHFLHFPGK